MYVFMGNVLIERASVYNAEYYCIIEKVEFLPGIIRVFIDERGDNSLGRLQNPMTSSLGILTENSLTERKNPIDGKFSISDESRQYYGYLDFALDTSLLNTQHIIGFEYGENGYSTTKLFRFNEELVDRLQLKLT